MLTSHAHKRMQTFTIWVKRASGLKEKLYETNDWHEPAVLNVDNVLQPGDGLYSETKYKNDSDKNITFGYTSEDEMNVILGYYWEE